MQMMFSRVNQRTIGNKNNNINNTNNNLNMLSSQNKQQSTFSMMKLYTPKPINMIVNSPVNNESFVQKENKKSEIDSIKTPIEKPKRMKWGEPTWFFLHTLAEKVKAEQFQYIRGTLLQNIYLICTNLPCPDCSNHAKTYLDSINFNRIRTKQELKEVLFVFHNSLNIKKGYSIFTREELNDKYNKAVLVNIYNNFMISFLDKHKSLRMIANDLFRSRIAVNVKDWFLNNISYFEA